MADAAAQQTADLQRLRKALDEAHAWRADASMPADAVEEAQRNDRDAFQRLEDALPVPGHNRPDPFKPDATLLAQLGSIAVHADELLSDDGHAFDRVALQQLLADPGVRAWLERMDRLAMIPKKRKP